MQIFTVIGQIEDLVENSPRPKINGATKRIIDIEEMMDLLGDLKVTIPSDIQRANSVIVDAQSMIEMRTSMRGMLLMKLKPAAKG